MWKHIVKIIYKNIHYLKINFQIEINLQGHLSYNSLVLKLGVYIEIYIIY